MHTETKRWKCDFSFQGSTKRVSQSKAVLKIFDSKTILFLPCMGKGNTISWCYISKWFSTILQNASLWCSFFVFHCLFGRPVSLCHTHISLLLFNLIFFHKISCIILCFKNAYKKKKKREKQTKSYISFPSSQGVHF